MKWLRKHGKLARILKKLLDFIPPGIELRILRGTLRGKKWIAGSGLHEGWLGTYEPDIRKIFEEEINVNDIIYDLGAMVGLYTLLAAELVQEQGQVFAFEPSPRNIYYLKKHVGINDYKNIKILEYAICDSIGEMKFSEGKSISTGHLSEDGKLAVETVSLDILVNRKEILPPHFIKMDIEGAEYEALIGAKYILEQYHPKLLISIHSKELYTKCTEYLVKMGYKIKLISGPDFYAD